jgi:hypothetical protein
MKEGGRTFTNFGLIDLKKLDFFSRNVKTQGTGDFPTSQALDENN